MIERKCYVCGLIWQVSIQQIHKPKKYICPQCANKKDKTVYKELRKKLNEVI